MNLDSSFNELLQNDKRFNGCLETNFNFYNHHTCSSTLTTRCVLLQAIAGCHFHVPFSGNLFFIVSKRKVGFVLPQNLMSEVCDLEKLPRFSFGELSMEERSECIDEQWGVSLFTTTKRK